MPVFLLLFLLASAAAAQYSKAVDEWNQPVEPFKIAGNLYYVGASGVSAFLVTDPKGHILIDSGFRETVPLVMAAIRKLNLKPEDIRYLLASHAHNDHVGGLVEMRRLTGAKILLSAEDAPQFERGGLDDPQFGDSLSYEGGKADRLLKDGDAIEVGSTRLIARITPGHTKGCTTWTGILKENGKQYDWVSTCSMTAPDYKLVNNPKYPDIIADFEKTFRVLRSLRCDIFTASHPSFFRMEQKREKGSFVDPEGFRRLIERSEAEIHRQVEAQRAKR
ncbi:MAG: subclass B3 metallo-beta-lactamase [Bryobacteraceae bacterium]|nr:subclass B3 metallo-beta-lactamase [Bryobacteraceae bacterium]